MERHRGGDIGEGVMEEFAAAVNERVRAAAAFLLQAQTDGDDYSACVHATELEWLRALAADHGVALA